MQPVQGVGRKRNSSRPLPQGRARVAGGRVRAPTVPPVQRAPVPELPPRRCGLRGLRADDFRHRSPRFAIFPATRRVQHRACIARRGGPDRGGDNRQGFRRVRLPVQRGRTIHRLRVANEGRITTGHQHLLPNPADRRGGGGSAIHRSGACVRRTRVRHCDAWRARPRDGRAARPRAACLRAYTSARHLGHRRRANRRPRPVRVHWHPAGTYEVQAIPPAALPGCPSRSGRGSASCRATGSPEPSPDRATLPAGQRTGRDGRLFGPVVFDTASAVFGAMALVIG